MCSSGSLTLFPSLWGKHGCIFPLSSFWCFCFFFLPTCWTTWSLQGSSQQAQPPCAERWQVLARVCARLPPSKAGCCVRQDLPPYSRSLFSLLQLFIPFCYPDIAASKLTPTKIPTAQNIPGWGLSPHSGGESRLRLLSEAPGPAKGAITLHNNIEEASRPGSTLLRVGHPEGQRERRSSMRMTAFQPAGPIPLNGMPSVEIPRKVNCFSSEAVT